MSASCDGHEDAALPPSRTRSVPACRMRPVAGGVRADSERFGEVLDEFGKAEGRVREGCWPVA